MQSPESLEEFRRLLLEAPESTTTATLAVVLSFALLVVVLFLVRRRRLREEFTPIWVAVAVGMAIVSLRPDLLRWLTQAIGAWTPSSTLFFLGELFLLSLCLNYAVRLSKAGSQIRSLAQETAILRARLDRLEAAPVDATDGE
jgi:hypothetical protein